VARGHLQIGPNTRKIVLFNPEQVDPLAAGDLHHRHRVFLGDIRDTAKF